ncbi:hypothetical protein, partial [uncultured Methylobacterium sp.]|uniref:hypothetical protein n=1 Tax=uncultured Methylobacterium sp. TaxID=157278 RepID=UPI0035CAE42E
MRMSRDPFHKYLDFAQSITDTLCLGEYICSLGLSAIARSPPDTTVDVPYQGSETVVLGAHFLNRIPANHDTILLFKAKHTAPGGEARVNAADRPQ